MGIVLALADLPSWQKGFEDLMPQVAVSALGGIEVWLGNVGVFKPRVARPCKLKAFSNWEGGKGRITLTEGLRDSGGGLRQCPQL